MAYTVLTVRTSTPSFQLQRGSVTQGLGTRTSHCSQIMHTSPATDAAHGGGQCHPADTREEVPHPTGNHCWGPFHICYLFDATRHDEDRKAVSEINNTEFSTGIRFPLSPKEIWELSLPSMKKDLVLSRGLQCSCGAKRDSVTPLSGF